MQKANTSLLMLNPNLGFFVESWYGYHIVYCKNEDDADELLNASLYQNVILSTNVLEQIEKNKRIKGKVLTLESFFNRFNGEIYVQFRNLRIPVGLNEWDDYDVYTIH